LLRRQGRGEDRTNINKKDALVKINTHRPAQRFMKPLPMIE